MENNFKEEILKNQIDSERFPEIALATNKLHSPYGNLNEDQNEENEINQQEKPKRSKCLFIEMNPGFNLFNLFSYYLVQFGYVMAFTILDSCQGYLLESKDYAYQINHDQAGRVNGNILLADTLYLVNKNIKLKKIIFFFYSYFSFFNIFYLKNFLKFLYIFFKSF
jgi:hypothetical protein